jgi:predicted dehydrogenase
MDEDYMADAAAPFGWRSEKQSGYGALDDFGVHAFSLLFDLFGPVAAVLCRMEMPYADRPLLGGGRRAVETFDVASLFFRLRTGASGLIALDRAAWGRKGRIALQVFGSGGSLLYDQERLNEIQFYSAADPAGEQGFRTILTGPAHPPYDRFIPAPGHSLGFNELKVIEAHELVEAIAGRPARIIDFETGLAIERTVHAAARSHEEGRWVEV